MAGMMSENLWPPHAIPRLPSKAAPSWVRASSAGPRPNWCLTSSDHFSIALEISQQYVEEVGYDRGGSSSLGLVRLTLANLPNHPHNPQPSNPPPPTTFSSQSPPPLASLVSHSGSLKSPPKLSCSPHRCMLIPVSCPCSGLCCRLLVPTNPTCRLLEKLLQSQAGRPRLVGRQDAGGDVCN